MWPGSLNLRLPPKSGLWLPACQGGPTAGSKGGEVLCPMTLRGVRTQPRWNEAPCLEPGSPEGVGGCYPEEPGRQPCALSPVRPVSFQEGGQRPSVRRKRQPTTRHLRYSEFITSHQGTTHSTGPPPRVFFIACMPGVWNLPGAQVLSGRTQSRQLPLGG